MKILQKKIKILTISNLLLTGVSTESLQKTKRRPDFIFFSIILSTIRNIQSEHSGPHPDIRATGSRSATNFSTFSDMSIPRPKTHSLDRVLSRGQILEISYLGRSGQKISRGKGKKLVAALEKLYVAVEKLLAAVKKLVAAWAKN